MRSHVSKQWLAALCIGTIFLTSCTPEFRNPLPAPKNLMPDEEILGTWYSTPTAEDEAQVSVLPRKSGWIDVVWIYDINSHTSTDGINMLVFEGYTTSVKQHKFLCLRLRKKDLHGDKEQHDNMGYLVVHYEITQEGILLTSPLSKKSVKRLIQAGELKGTIRKQKHTEVITVTSSSKELVDVIARQGIKDFLDEDDVFNLSWSKLTKAPNKSPPGDGK